MELLGEHSKRKVYWWSYSEETLNELPNKPWVCFAIADELPGLSLFENFTKTSIRKNIFEFKAFGKMSSKLDNFFDEVMVMEAFEGKTNPGNIMTTWHDKEGLASAFWQCFHATCIPEDLDTSNIKIVCLHFQNLNLKEELKNYINKFNEGWIPSENE